MIWNNNLLEQLRVEAEEQGIEILEIETSGTIFRPTLRIEFIGDRGIMEKLLFKYDDRRANEL